MAAAWAAAEAGFGRGFDRYTAVYGDDATAAAAQVAKVRRESEEAAAAQPRRVRFDHRQRGAHRHRRIERVAATLHGIQARLYRQRMRRRDG